MNFYRQGDVGLMRTDEPVPAAAALVEPDNNRVILAYGEVTGHAHAIACDYAKMYRWEDQKDGTVRLLEVKEGAELRHEEHDTIALPPGRYRVIQQREYHPEAIRNVAD